MLKQKATFLSLCIFDISANIQSSPGNGTAVNDKLLQQPLTNQSVSPGRSLPGRLSSNG